MRKIKSAVAAVAVAAGMLASPLAAGTANAVTTYTWSNIDRCASVRGSQNNDCIELGANSTYSQTQVWINGSVHCRAYSGSVTYSWCGVGGGNGTRALNIGVNFTFSGIGGLYERMNLFAGGNTAYGGDGPGCHMWGSNSDTNGITNWWNDDGGFNTNPPPVPGGGTICEEPV